MCPSPYTLAYIREMHISSSFRDGFWFGWHLSVSRGAQLLRLAPTIANSHTHHSSHRPLSVSQLLELATLHLKSKRHTTDSSTLILCSDLSYRINNHRHLCPFYHSHRNKLQLQWTPYYPNTLGPSPVYIGESSYMWNIIGWFNCILCNNVYTWQTWPYMVAPKR